MSTTSITTAEAPLLLRVNQVAAQLQIGRSTVYALIFSGELESCLVGRSRRIKAASVQQYVNRLCGEALDDKDLTPDTTVAGGGAPASR